MFSDLYFSSRIIFTITAVSTHHPKMNKTQCGNLKKFQNFCPRDIESCHLETARCGKLWSLNANSFFKEPHQLTKFNLNNIWRRTFQIKDLIAIYFGLQTVPYSLTKPDFFRFRAFFGACSLQNEVGDPPFLLPFWLR